MPRRSREEADELSVTIFKMKMAGKRNKEIATELNLHPSTVSTKLSSMRRQLKDIDDRIAKGDLVLKEDKQQTTALALPTQNPFSQLSTFEEMAGITSAGGAVIGAGAAEVVRAFKDESAPYEQRLNSAMKGGAVIIGSALSLWLTIQNLTKDLDDLNKPKEIKNVTPESQYTTVTTPGQSTTRMTIVNDKAAIKESTQTSQG
jgi:hypothetical protein